ncbi:ribosome-associated protein [Humidesulfovibrio mexicanus]|uniref:Ribosomal silencing factor RsfS n=1 Tax=Humidesulfovibrio mexicanus TaxID=147047 RepID=A0A238XPA5_9BACT|nr:ribosome silencing factor [Humidesulfovibrio mexicanus]SNR60540.1 ribosome-associated protein [Humidesulfovibrio mexicanus]
MKKKANPTVPAMPTPEKSQMLAALLDDKQAEDIVVLDVSGLCPIAENIIIAGARGQRHAQSLADAVMDAVKDRKLVSFGVEGYDAGTWILADLNDVIVHIFQEDMRRMYNIEGLWAEGRRVDAPAGRVSAADLED